MPGSDPSPGDNESALEDLPDTPAERDGTSGANDSQLQADRPPHYG